MHESQRPHGPSAFLGSVDGGTGLAPEGEGEPRALPEAAAPGEDMAKLAYKRRSFEPAKI